MVYVSSTDGKCYNSEDLENFTMFLCACYGFELISARTALEIINRFDRIA